MGRRRRPFGNLSVIILKKKMGLRPILILQGFQTKPIECINIHNYSILLSPPSPCIFCLTSWLSRNLPLLTMITVYTLVSSIQSTRQSYNNKNEYLQTWENLGSPNTMKINVLLQDGNWPIYQGLGFTLTPASRWGGCRWLVGGFAPAFYKRLIRSANVIYCDLSDFLSLGGTKVPPYPLLII